MVPMRNGLNGTVFIFAALYPEAQPLIKALHLKKDASATVFQQYVGEDDTVRLVLTGTGPVRAAAAAGYVIAGDPDISIVNYGSCGGDGSAEAGTLYRCCKLANGDEHRAYYPDLLLASSLPEAEVVTESRMWAREEDLPQDPSSNMPVLHDMEAAAIYEAGNLCLGPHRMHFLKFVSDFGEGGRVTPQKLQESSACVSGEAVRYIEDLREYHSGHKDAGHSGLVDLCERLGTDLHASVTMKAQLRQLLRYAFLADIDVSSLIDSLYKEGKLPARDKRSGAKVLQELKENILFEEEEQK